MRVIRWKNAVTGVESLNITATGIYFPVGKTDSSFIARYSMVSAGQTASVERVSSPNGSRVGSPAINVSGTTEVVVNERRGLSTGIIVTAISGTLISVLDDNTPITNFPDAGLGRFPTKEDADAYVYGAIVPQGLPVTINGTPYSWGGAGVGWLRVDGLLYCAVDPLAVVNAASTSPVDFVVTTIPGRAFGDGDILEVILSSETGVSNVGNDSFVLVIGSTVIDGTTAAAALLTQAQFGVTKNGTATRKIIAAAATSFRTNLFSTTAIDWSIDQIIKVRVTPATTGNSSYVRHIIVRLTKC